MIPCFSIRVRELYLGTPAISKMVITITGTTQARACSASALYSDILDTMALRGFRASSSVGSLPHRAAQPELSWPDHDTGAL